ncbi:MAG: FtsX-like permease family protein [Gemmataceae bacterium]
MRFPDLVRSALRGLWQQKARTFLTLTGVIVGTCSFAFSFSLGVGLRRMIDTEFQKRDEFWWIRAYTTGGFTPEDEAKIPESALNVPADLPEEMRARLRQAKITEYIRTHPPQKIKLITPELIEKLKAIPDVLEVRTQRQNYGQFTVNDRNGFGQIVASRLDIYDPPLESRLIHGRLPNEGAMECVVTEWTLFQLGYRTMQAMDSVVGRSIKLTIGESETQKGMSLAAVLGPRNPSEAISQTQATIFEKLVKQLPGKIDSFDLSPLEKQAVKAAMTRKSTTTDPKIPRATATYTIVGYVRLPNKDERTLKLIPSKLRDYNTDVFLSPGSGETLFGQLSETVDRGFPEVSIHCRPHGDLKQVVKEIDGLGLQTITTLQWYQSAKLEVTLISVGLNVFSIVALFIAAIGITNTLVTTVLERTREIGILKALGAKDGEVTALFLAEGMAVGLIGGLIGVATACLLAVPADSLVFYLVRKVNENITKTTTIFEFPIWLTLGSVGFAVFITTVASWYPARRAARIEPVEALRHE